MSRKRSLKGGGVGRRAPGWDALPWKSIEPPLECDDGWRSMGGDEQAVLYTLEEISGNDYSLQSDHLGGSQVVVAGTSITADELTTTRATAGGGGEGAGTVSESSAAADASNPTKTTKKKKGKKRKAKQQDGGEAKQEGDAQAIPAVAVSGVTTVVETAAVKGESAEGDHVQTATVSTSASESEANKVVVAGNASGTRDVDGAVGQNDDDGTRPRRKKRRGQGKKNRAAAAAAAAAAAGASGETASAAAQLDCREGFGGGIPAVSMDVVVGKQELPVATRARGSDVVDAARARNGAAASSAAVVVSGAGKDGEPPTEEVVGRNQPTGDVEAAAKTPLGSEAPKSKKRNKRKNRKKKKKDGGVLEDADGNNGDAAGAGGREGRNWELGEEDSAKMAPWMYLGVELHPALLWHLHRQGFHDPTPIQHRVLPKAVLGRKDIIAAAETGSGKTLAFGLPVLSEILTRRDALAAAAADKESEEVSSEVAGGAAAGGGDDLAGSVDAAKDGDEMVVVTAEEGNASGGDVGGVEEGHTGDGVGLQALVLCPTRELALQVAAHLREVVGGTGLAVVAVVGGLAEVKQERQLSRRPEVVVATPGRFWELSGTHAHLSRLETLRHLVIDEADRMLERGHYPELNRLFSLLGTAEEREEGGGASVGGEDGNGRNSKAVAPGGYKSTFPFDISEGGEWSVPAESSPFASPDGDGSSSPHDGVGVAMDEDDDNSSSNDQGLDNASIPKPPSVMAPLSVTASPSSVAPVPRCRREFARQTYVFSATLTLGASGRQQRKKKSGGGKGKGRAKATADDDDPIAKIMKRVGVRGEPAVIDMGRRTVVEGEGEGESGGSTPGAGEAALPALPSTLRLCSIKSLQMEKDIHAYLFCTMYPGRTLIFVNAIVCARRLSELLCSLKVPATPLHAQMQQRQRLKSLDRFTSNPKAVLVATDVAARGLDIPKVEHVVHYDAARSAEVFIHRAGRTARARAAGLSLSIVAPRDDANHRQTCSVLGLHDGMQGFPVDVRLMDRARERVCMALRVLKFQEQQNKVSASNDFFRGMSRDADLIVDGDLFMDQEGAVSEERPQGRRGGAVKGLGRKGNQHAARLAAEARQSLEASLSRPLHSDRRKLIPVAQTLTDMKMVSARTASGDLAGRHKA